MRADPDTTLVEALRSGHPEAPADLYSRYQRRVMSHALYLLKNREDAEEIVQDTMLRIIQKIHLFRGECASFSTWVFRVTFNVSMSKLRMRRRIKHQRIIFNSETAEIAQESLHHDETPEVQLLYAELQALVDVAVKNLPDDQRVPVQVADYGDQRGSAEAIGITLNVFKKRLHAARKQLRAELAGVL